MVPNRSDSNISQGMNQKSLKTWEMQDKHVPKAVVGSEYSLILVLEFNLNEFDVQLWLISSHLTRYTDWFRILFSARTGYLSNRFISNLDCEGL